MSAVDGLERGRVAVLKTAHQRTISSSVHNAELRSSLRRGEEGASALFLGIYNVDAAPMGLALDGSAQRSSTVLPDQAANLVITQAEKIRGDALIMLSAC